MKTQYYVASSLDGFIADPHGSLDWLLQFPMTDDYPGFIREVGAVAMGSTTYAWVLAHLAETSAGGDAAWPYEQPAWVFTSRELSAPAGAGAGVRFVRGDVRPAHEEMAAAAGGKNIWIVGGGDLAGQFHDHGLLDELIVTVAPVTLGGGAPLLPRRIAQLPLQLADVNRRGEAFVQLRYEVRR
jgi:dihydrofolate reductase